LIRVIALNELRRRLRDRSVLIGCLAAPLLMSAVLGLSFAGGAEATSVHIGVSGASPQLMAAAVRASQLPAGVTVVAMPSQQAVKDAVVNGRLDGGVALLHDQLHLDSLLVPIVDPGATNTPGFDVVTKGTSQLGEEYAESVAAGLSSVLYAARVPHDGNGARTATAAAGTATAETTAAETTAAETTAAGRTAGSASDGSGRSREADSGSATVAITTQNVGHGGKVNLNFFAPNIAVVFLFIGSGLGMRSLLMERAAGTLARVTAAPVRPTTIVLGKLLAIFVTGLATIFVIWAVTTFAFGADWGSPLGVLLMCVAATVAMCGIGVFLTSLAKTEQQAFGITLLVGLFLALLGGNLLPSGSLPDVFQVLALGTPNGWALVGFGRLDQLREPASSVIGPVLVLLAIAAVTGGLAMTRVRKMVEP
jgi:ABC-2 type transport system permease protein